MAGITKAANSTLFDSTQSAELIVFEDPEGRAVSVPRLSERGWRAFLNIEGGSAVIRNVTGDPWQFDLSELVRLDEAVALYGYEMGVVTEVLPFDEPFALTIVDMTSNGRFLTGTLDLADGSKIPVSMNGYMTEGAYFPVPLTTMMQKATDGDGTFYASPSMGLGNGRLVFGDGPELDSTKDFQLDGQWYLGSRSGPFTDWEGSALEALNGKLRILYMSGSSSTVLGLAEGEALRIDAVGSGFDWDPFFEEGDWEWVVTPLDPPIEGWTAHPTVLSGDAAMAGGYCVDSNGLRVPVLWDGAEPTQVALPPSVNSGEFNSLDHDGKQATGFLWPEGDTSASPTVFYWSEPTGIVPLEDLLRDTFGISTSLRFQRAALTHWGDWLYGEAIDSTERQVGFAVRLPIRHDEGDLVFPGAETDTSFLSISSVSDDGNLLTGHAADALNSKAVVLRAGEVGWERLGRSRGTFETWAETGRLQRGIHLATNSSGSQIVVYNGTLNSELPVVERWTPSNGKFTPIEPPSDSDFSFFVPEELADDGTMFGYATLKSGDETVDLRHFLRWKSNEDFEVMDPRPLIESWNNSEEIYRIVSSVTTATADGSSFAGYVRVYSHTGNDERRPVAWRESEGLSALPLPESVDLTLGSGVSVRLSRDGRWAAGALAYTYFVRWDLLTEEVKLFPALSIPEDHWLVSVTWVSLDGRTIFGICGDRKTGSSHAYVWEDETPIPAAEYLASTYGIDCGNLTLASLHMNQAETFFFGQVERFDGSEAYIVRKPLDPTADRGSDGFNNQLRLESLTETQATVRRPILPSTRSAGRILEMSAGSFENWEPVTPTELKATGWFEGGAFWERFTLPIESGASQSIWLRQSSGN
jgi:hypothetical protein